jgi:hypothetical protein
MERALRTSRKENMERRQQIDEMEVELSKLSADDVEKGCVTPCNRRLVCAVVVTCPHDNHSV